MGNVLSPQYTYEETTLDLGPWAGKWLGTLVDGKVKRFLGIPYALPPTGNYRWRRPRALPESYTYGSKSSPWSETDPSNEETHQPFDATQFRAVCPQIPFPGAPPSKMEYGEDCLSVNIWMPVGEAPKDGWPVLVWFHGGLLQAGNPCVDALSDPTELISTKGQGAGLDCIFMAVGYRVGVYGFLGGEELRKEAEEDAMGHGTERKEERKDGAWGNYGLWDQREALRWLRRFGRAMDADLERVTIAGMSAGAYSVHARVTHALLMDDEDVGFIKRIVLHSNAIPCNPKSEADVQPQFNELLAVLYIPASLTVAEKLARLRAVSAARLLDAVKGMKMGTFRPVADGVFFPRDLMRRFANGDFARGFEERGMSVLVGEVLNEECTYRMDAPKEMDGLRDKVANLYPLSITDKLLQAYTEEKIQLAAALPDPNPNISDVAKVYGDIISDGQVRAPERLLISQLKDAGVPLGRVHRYRIAWKPEFVRRMMPDIMGVPHGSDTVIWNYGIRHGVTDEERAVMKAWIGDLVKFVHDEPMDYGTRDWREMKQLGADGKISVVEDHKWDYLMHVAYLMSGLGE